MTELYYPEETSTGYYMTKIAEGLAGDFEVSALCGQPNYSKRGTKAAKREIHNRVSIYRAFGTTLDKNVIPFRLINMITLSFALFFRAVSQLKQGDKVLVVTTPPLLPFIAALASLIKGSEYILLIHDNYPEILNAVGKSSPHSIVSRVLAFANRWLYKYASKIIVVGRDMEELVARKTAGLDIPIVTIPNWAELESVKPQPRQGNRLIKELGLEDKFVFLYAGNMGYPNDIEILVKCADELRSDPRPHFVFLGAGVKRAWLERAVKELELANVTILDPKPRSEQIEFLNACDAGIVSLISQMKGVSMPSRTYNILAAGKPILAIAEPGSEIARVTEEDNVGYVVKPGDVCSLNNVVSDFLLLDADELAAMGERARKAAVSKYSLERAIDAYRAAIS
ncbi:MAG: glycosyltransferase family 4 protein [Pyrinomonadaceae bacterium]|nr:glycosyltransferase family 4 protein [Pyrinomonadaceae bacterium]